jgi:hypothetical protein
MTTATAVRNYTVEQITPLLNQLDNGKFNPETGPSFAAQRVFKPLTGDLHDYSYREASLNPTNPADFASPFETELIESFIRDQEQQELSEIRQVGDDSQFYLARRIIMNSASFLVCHSTPDAAPTSMLEAYATQNGFGRELNNVVAIQLLTIPVNNELVLPYELVALVFAMLILLFIVVSFAVTLPL